MIHAAAVVPTAPLLVAGVSATVPPEVEAVRGAVRAVLGALPASDVLVLVGTAEIDAPVVHDEAHATLAGFGRPDLAARQPLDGEVTVDLSGRATLGRVHGGSLPPSLAVLSLLVHQARAAAADDGDGVVPVVPIAVPRWAAFGSLVAVGSAVARVARERGLVTSIVAGGDLSAGLDDRAPLHRIAGARHFDDVVVDVVSSGRLGGLERVGPVEARRVWAIGWASLAVLHGACAAAKIGLVVRHRSAPRGVGYLVARG